MKNNLRLLVLGLGMAIPSLAQKDNVGIGTAKPDQSAVLDVSSSTKGLLMPRMSLTQRSSIQNPAEGLVVYQTDFLSGFYFYDGKEWKPLTSETKANSTAGTDGDWTLEGNNISATPNAFIGTTGAGQALLFKVEGASSGKIDGVSQSLYLGFGSGYNNSNTAVRNVGLGTSSMGSLAAGMSNATDNVGIGYQALAKISTGANNLAVGTYALANSTAGSGNLAFGYSALGNTQGNGNTGIGANALANSVTGSGNIAIGTNAGVNKEGSNNVYLGIDAGRAAAAATENNTLHIGSSLTNPPLIKGEFDNKNLKINLGSTTSNAVGFLAIGNFDAAFTMPASNSYRLVVQDGIITEKIKVALKSSVSDWSDYVFEDGYKRMSLEDVEQFVKANKHLPNVPTTEEMMASGSDLIKTDAKLLEKIEELTLYMIEMNKEIKALKAENEKLKK